MENVTANGGRIQSLPTWLVATVVTAILGVATGSIGTINSNSNRISVLEAMVREHRDKLDRIDHKIDRLLEQRAAHP
jgi:hypothetical protein